MHKCRPIRLGTVAQNGENFALQGNGGLSQPGRDGRIKVVAKIGRAIGELKGTVQVLDKSRRVPTKGPKPRRRKIRKRETREADPTQESILQVNP